MYWCSFEPSHWDTSNEYPQHRFSLRNDEISDLDSLRYLGLLIFHLDSFSHPGAVTLCMLGNFWCGCCQLIFFSKSTFWKNSFRNTIRVSNSLGPDQDLQIWTQAVFKVNGQMTKVVASRQSVNHAPQTIPRKSEIPAHSLHFSSNFPFWALVRNAFYGQLQSALTVLKRIQVHVHRQINNLKCFWWRQTLIWLVVNCTKLSVSPVKTRHILSDLVSSSSYKVTESTWRNFNENAGMWLMFFSCFSRDHAKWHYLVVIRKKFEPLTHKIIYCGSF